MTVRVLAVGDMHLGRRVARIPAAARDLCHESDLSPSGAWRELIAAARRLDVDAVLLAGDVVDREEDFFEAYRVLERGLAELAEAEIPVVAVAGNHDVHVLPRLARQVSHLTVLGLGGQWESTEIWPREGAGGPVTVVGWSFPAAQVSHSPLVPAPWRDEQDADLTTVAAWARPVAPPVGASGSTSQTHPAQACNPVQELVPRCQGPADVEMDLGTDTHTATRDGSAPTPGLTLSPGSAQESVANFQGPVDVGFQAEDPKVGGRATLGLLHCDRDRRASRYAPVSSEALLAAPVDAWFLGHIHVPDHLQGPRPIGYLGSLMGLDVAQTGRRGAWLVSIEAAGEIVPVQLPSTGLRWESVAITLDAAANRTAALDECLDALFAHDVPHQALAAVGDDPAPRALGIRLSLTVDVAERAAVESYLTRLQPTEQAVRHREVVCFVHTVDIVGAQTLEVESWLDDPSWIGALARRVAVLDRPADDPERCRLLARALDEVKAVHRRSPYRVLGGELPAADEVAENLRQSARVLLERMLAQGARGQVTSRPMASGPLGSGQIGAELRESGDVATGGGREGEGRGERPAPVEVVGAAIAAEPNVGTHEPTLGADPDEGRPPGVAASQRRREVVDFGIDRGPADGDA